MGEVKWTATRIDIANYCRMKYWLNYVEHAPGLRLPAFPKGSLLHEVIQHFWTRLGSEEDLRDVKMNKKGDIIKRYVYRGNKVKYHSPESFATYAMGKWAQVIIQDNILKKEIKDGKYTGAELEKKNERLIAWSDHENPWVIKYGIRDISKLLFDILVEEGPPLYSELKFDFVLRDLYFEDNPKNVFDLWFSGRIDEVRLRDGKVVIRDYKSGKPWIDDMKIKYDPQLTFYNAGLCSLLKKDERLAYELGVEDRREEYMGNPIFIDTNFVEEFFMVEAPLVAKRMIEKDPKVDLNRLPKIFHPTMRSDAHFFELMRMIKGTEESMVGGIIYAERGRKCDACNFKSSCENKLEDAIKKAPEQSNGQGLFDFAAATYEKKFIVGDGRDPITGMHVREVDTRTDSKKLQRRFNFNRLTSY